MNLQKLLDEYNQLICQANQTGLSYTSYASLYIAKLLKEYNEPVFVKKNTNMSEKEFLKKAINIIASANDPDDITTEQELNDAIDKFLEEFHKEYYEVEFVRKDIGKEMLAA